MLVMAIVSTATSFTMKANNEKPMNDMVQANVEALSSNETGCYCYGKGSIICPYSGDMVAGYFKMHNIE